MGEFEQDAAAANVLSEFLAIRDVPDITSAPADLCVVCGSSILATMWVHRTHTVHATGPAGRELPLPPTSTNPPTLRHVHTCFSQLGNWSCPRYVAVQAVKAGTVPKLLISGGSGHSTIHLYNSIRNHPIWRTIPTHEGRHEAEVG
jgi:hypothetical protein